MQRSAFSLVELSIVLVILGLLTGGILAGQSLIRASELRSTVTQSQRYLTAVQTFRDKYFALPGDMTNATAFWGTSTNCPGTSAQGNTDGKTCNGDGNGYIYQAGGGLSDEPYRFWQQLANAGLIEGQYNGVPAGTYTYSSTTTNSPAGRVGSSLWFAYYWGAQTGATTLFDGQYDNVLMIGGASSNNIPTGAIFKPEEVWNMDTKLDDGKPATGKTVVFAASGFSACTDASASSTLTANYLLTNSTVACGIAFRQAF